MAEKQKSMKKKVLFVLPDYCHGGTNKSMENLLHFLDNQKFEICIYVLYADGGHYYRDVFRPYVLRKSLLYYFAHDNWLTRKVMGALMKLSKKVNFNWLYHYEVNRLHRKYHFDTIIAYQEATPTVFVSLLNDTSVNTIAWIHCNYGAVHNYKIVEGDEKLYSWFRHIVCVSKTTLQSFTNIYPILDNRCTYIYNLIDCYKLNKMADNHVHFVSNNKNCFYIISVGRYTAVKQFEKIPWICKKVMELSNRSFCWYIIGDGDNNLIESTKKDIETYDLQGKILLLGAKDNPYPYIKKANLLVSTSCNEAYPYVIAEAKALGTPVLANNFPSASEVVPPEYGWICPIVNMPQLIVELIADNNEKYSRVKNSMATGLRCNNEIVQKMESLL